MSLSLLSAIILLSINLILFFLYDTATTEIYTLSLHDALPIFSNHASIASSSGPSPSSSSPAKTVIQMSWGLRSEEHTSELQSLTNLVCRLLLEKKKKI